jgi:hypothetical protein
MLLLSSIQAIRTDPGRIPGADSATDENEWSIVNNEEESDSVAIPQPHRDIKQRRI